MKTAYLGLGSNLGDRAANLLRAICALTQTDRDIGMISSIYETDPIDYRDQPAFLNLVVSVKGESLDPFSLLGTCLGIERKLGRERTVPKGPRTIDLDLLMLDDLIVRDSRDGIDLILPHPRMHLRRFVLTPLAEIAPQLRHPVLGKTISDLLITTEDSASVHLYQK